MDEVENWAELFEDDQDGSFLSADDTELSPSLVAPAFVEKDGLLRVGPPPVKEVPFVWTAPAETAQGIIQTAVRRNFRHTDSKLHEHDLSSQMKEVELDHLSRLVSHTEDRVYMVCDYRGSNLS
jgi:hypothetical protein